MPSQLMLRQILVYNKDFLCIVKNHAFAHLKLSKYLVTLWNVESIEHYYFIHLFVRQGNALVLIVDSIEKLHSYRDNH